MLRSTNGLYYFVLSFAFGVLIATFTDFNLPTINFLILLSVVSGLFWYRSRLVSAEVVGWFLLAMILLGFSCGFLRTDIAKSQFGHSILEEQVGSKVSLNGIVRSEPDKRENNLRLFVEVDNDLVLVTTDRYTKVDYGDEVNVEGKISKPENFTTDFGRTFDYTGYLLAKGIEYQISFAEVSVEESGKGNFIIAKLLHFKSAFINNIEALIPEPAVGLGEGLLLGVKQSLGEELEDAFRSTGIIHIVVLSGYNIMLVVVFVMYILGYFLSARPKIFVGILAIVAFALLVGLSATVMRASIMAVLLLLAQATGRMYLVLRGLLVAGFIMILFNPYLLVYDIGFQLSFLATLGLILIAPHLENLFLKAPTIAGVKMFVVATVATQIAVLPLLLYQIGQFSVVAVLVNVLVLPMVPVAMLLTFITGMLGFVSVNLAWLFSYPTYWSLTYINEVALWFADFSFASFVVPAFSFYFVPLSYALMGYVLYRMYKPEIGMGYSEMGEKLLQTTVDESNQNKQPSFDDWTIVEEEDISFSDQNVKSKNAEVKNTSANSDVPIFFR